MHYKSPRPDPHANEGLSIAAWPIQQVNCMTHQAASSVRRHLPLPTLGLITGQESLNCSSQLLLCVRCGLGLDPLAKRPLIHATELGVRHESHDPKDQRTSCGRSSLARGCVACPYTIPPTKLTRCERIAIPTRTNRHVMCNGTSRQWLWPSSQATACQFTNRPTHT